jgi:hypothetical protein
MSRATDSREVLIAEALGDFGQLLDRIEAVTPSLHQTRDELEFTATRLLNSVEPFQTRIVTMALEAQNRAVTHIAQQATLAARKTFDEQVRAMQTSARSIFHDEVVPPLRRLQAELQDAIKEAHRPWDLWLTHAATAVMAASCTWMLLVYLALPRTAAETKPPVSAVSPGYVEPAARPELVPHPEKARVRK